MINYVLIDRASAEVDSGLSVQSAVKKGNADSPSANADRADGRRLNLPSVRSRPATTFEAL